MKKTLLSVLITILVCVTIVGCGESDSKTNGQTANASEEKEIEKNSTAGSIEYLDAILKVNGGEYIHDDTDGEDYFCLHMNYTNNSSEAYELASAFVIVADQGNGSIDARQSSDYNSETESSAWKELEAGENADCDYYFPVEASKSVTIQVMNPDGMDTVLAEFEYSPE